MKSPFGFWTINALNISICAIPKGGSTMNRQIIAKAANVLGEKCFFDWTAENNELLSKNGVSTEYSSATTNILIVRDPWTRAVSSFVDQINRKYIPNSYNYTSFLHFLDFHANDDHLHHTGTASKKCSGFRGARFDHIINLEDISSFAKTSLKVPQYSQLIEHGWEHCTGGDPRLYMPGSIASHKNKNTHLKYILCTQESLNKVCQVYADDYILYSRLGHPFECKCNTEQYITVTNPPPLPSLPEPLPPPPPLPSLPEPLPPPPPLPSLPEPLPPPPPLPSLPEPLPPPPPLPSLPKNVSNISLNDSITSLYNVDYKAVIFPIIFYFAIFSCYKLYICLRKKVLLNYVKTQENDIEEL